MWRKVTQNQTYHGNDQVVDEHDGGLAEQEGGDDASSERHHVRHDERLCPEELVAAVFLDLPHLK